MNPHRAAPGWAWVALAHLPAGELPVQGGPELSQEPQRGSVHDLSGGSHFTQ